MGGGTNNNQLKAIKGSERNSGSSGSSNGGAKRRTHSKDASNRGNPKGNDKLAQKKDKRAAQQ
jgi:hypothetical protein